MIIIVASSNYLVLFPINDWLTWGAFPYPAAFLITEITNKFYGPKTAKQVVFSGFIFAAFLSIWLATPNIALASCSAFLLSQLLDIYIFNRLRNKAWWYSPFFASTLSSVIDTLIFWNIAFYGESVPLTTWMLGDFAIKFALDILFLYPFRIALRKYPATT
jgi:uncharacterized PurR-regulated membrane protein YhhQ (DUF165 family)